MFGQHSNGALGPPETRGWALVLLPPRCRSFWQCLYFRNVTGGRNVPSALSTALQGPPRAGKCIFGWRWGFRCLADVRREQLLVSEALSRSLAIAEQYGDTAHQAGLLNMEHYFHARKGDLKSALDCARRCGAIADASDDLAVKALAHAMLGRALQTNGELAASRAELDALMRIISQSNRGPMLLSYDPHYHSYIALARTLWLQGYPTQALELTHQGVEASEAMGHPAALALVLAGAASIFLLAGDLDAAQDHTDLSLSHAEANALGPLVAIGHSRKAELAILRGNNKVGVRDLQATLERLHAARHEVLTTEFNDAYSLKAGALDDRMKARS